VHDNIEKLLPAAVEYVLQEGVLEYDKQFKDDAKKCARAVFSPTPCLAMRFRAPLWCPRACRRA